MAVFENAINGFAIRWVADHQQDRRLWQVLVKAGAKPAQAAVIFAPFERESTTILTYAVNQQAHMELDGTRTLSASSRNAAVEAIVRPWLLRTQQNHRHFDILPAAGYQSPVTVLLPTNNLRVSSRFYVYAERVLADWPGMPELWRAGFEPLYPGRVPQQLIPRPFESGTQATIFKAKLD
jgi:hypothetical protein